MPKAASPSSVAPTTPRLARASRSYAQGERHTPLGQRPDSSRRHSKALRPPLQRREPAAETDRDFRELLNPDSLKVVDGVKVEPFIAENANPGTRFQFQRVGYFTPDYDSRPGALVFNRTIALKDSWEKEQKRMANDSSLNPHSSGDDSRRELYDRFRSELATNRSSLYFDEEELVELYDYASDLRDRYTALEVLFCGERLYPSSVALAERKVLFYLAIDDEAAVAALETLPDDSVIKRLTALRVARTGPEEARRELDSLLATKAELNDEEIIQICDTAEELGLYSWLIDNRSKIAALTDYPPTFLYELCQIAQSQDPDEALKILEELTMMEPFSIDFGFSPPRYISSSRVHPKPSPQWSMRLP